MLILATFYPVRPTLYPITDIEYGMVRAGCTPDPTAPPDIQRFKALLTPQVRLLSPDGRKLPRIDSRLLNDIGFYVLPHRGLATHLRYIKEAPNGIL